MSWIDIEDPSTRTLPNALAQQAATNGDRTFLQFGGRTLTYSETDSLSNSYANALAELGVGKGSSVALFSSECEDIILLAFATNKLGAFWVPINRELRGEMLVDPLESADADVLFLDCELAPRLAEIWERASFKTLLIRGSGVNETDFPGAKILNVDELAKATNAPISGGPSSRDLASVLWTSGTTGRSKGVMQSHHAWIYQTFYFQKKRQVKEAEVFYNCLPTYNSGAWILGIFAALVSGGTVAIDETFSVSSFWERIRYYGANHTATMGSMHMYLWQAESKNGDLDNPLRTIYAVPMSREVMADFRRRFGVEFVLQTYGNSEVMGLSFTEPNREGTPGSAGFVREDFDVKIVDDDDFEVPFGEVGEICARSKIPYTLFSGYFKNPEASFNAIRDLWYRTGDMGKLNADGELFWIDRKKDFLRHKGRNISSFEVEQIAQQHPDVKEVAVVGVPAAELASDDEILLVVVTNDGSALNAESLAKFINDRAPYYFVPRYIQFLNELPHTSTGRVQKHVLADQWEDSKDSWDREASNFVVKR
jgi:crotonobetaine/carnitine-CoA ligase